MIFVVLEESGMKSEVRFVYKILMEQISYTWGSVIIGLSI